MLGLGGRERPAASQVWRAELHGAAPLALLASKPRGLRSPSGTRTGKTRVDAICVAKDHYQPARREVPSASYGMEALALGGLTETGPASGQYADRAFPKTK
jgi:hypothetical protein